MSNPKQLVREYLKAPYARLLVPEEDGTYSAELLEFPGCFAEGDTPNEAIQNLERSATAWIEAALERGQDIPEPHATYGYSGKLNLRLPRSIHKQAARFAQRDDVSLNQFLACATAARVGAEEFYDRLVERIEARLREHALILNVSAVSVLQSVRVQYGMRSDVPSGAFVHQETDRVMPIRFEAVETAKSTDLTKD
jgi:predicted RNase H-like HicB family nuclease